MYWLNDILIAPATNLKTSIRRIRRDERAASGRMITEVVAIKRALSLEYNLITEADLRHLLDILAGRVFHIFRHPDPQSPTGERITTVTVENVDANWWYRDITTGIRCWKDVTIGLIEQ